MQSETLEKTPSIEKAVKTARQIIRAYNHPARFKMLQLLQQQDRDVTSIYVCMHMEQSVASQQLAILRKANLVKCRRDGKQMIYSANLDAISRLVGCCELIGAILKP